MKRKITYLLLIAVTSLAAITRDVEFIRFLLAFEVLFAVIMAVWVHWMARKLKISMVLSSESIYRGDKVTISVKIENPTFFPASDIAAVLCIREMTGGTEEGRGALRKVNGYTGADRKGTDCMRMQVQPVHCGLIGVCISEMKIFDYIGLFSARVRRKEQEKTVAVLPRIHEMSLDYEMAGIEGQAYTREIAAAKAGADSQEIFDTRLYQSGDIIKNIHWKLSAKADNLMVKEFSLPLDLTIPLVLDCFAEKPEDVSADKMDDFLELAASVGNVLMEREAPFEFLWYGAAEKEFYTSRVNGEDTLYRAMEEMLGVQPYRENGQLEEYLSAQSRTQEVEMLRVTIDGALYMGDKEIGYSINKDFSGADNEKTT